MESVFWLAGFLFTFGYIVSTKGMKIKNQIVLAFGLLVLWPLILGAHMQKDD